MRLPILLLVSALTLFSRLAPAEALHIEVIPVHGDARAAAEVIRPLVEKPGSVSAYEGRLVIRATGAELAAIRDVLREIDRPARTLLLSVRHDTGRDTTRLDAGGSLRLGGDGVRYSSGAGAARRPGTSIRLGPGEVRASGRYLRTRSRHDSAEHQTLRLLEGHPGFISAGTDVPVATRSTTTLPQGTHTEDSVQYRRAGTGFYVRARLRAEQVLIDISTERSRRSPLGGGIFSTTESYTTLSTELGRWVEIGASAERRTSRQGQTLHATRSHGRSDYRIWLKVDLAH